MNGQEIYNEIENAWHFGAVQCLSLETIMSGKRKANPEAWTFEQQHVSWKRVTDMLRRVLDGLEDLKKETA